MGKERRVNRGKRHEVPAKRREAVAKPVAKPAETGWLTVDSVPFAVIWVDDQRAGETPLIRFAVPAGTHEVRAVTSAGEGRTFVAEVAAGQTVRRRFRFAEGR